MHWIGMGGMMPAGCSLQISTSSMLNLSTLTTPAFCATRSLSYWHSPTTSKNLELAAKEYKERGTELIRLQSSPIRISPGFASLLRNRTPRQKNAQVAPNPTDNGGSNGARYAPACFDILMCVMGA